LIYKKLPAEKSLMPIKIPSPSIFSHHYQERREKNRTVKTPPIMAHKFVMKCENDL
jgi:hypothetical protein